MCEKKTFENIEDANQRAVEINKENGNSKMRPYKREECNRYHLTSMHKKKYRYISDPKYRSKIDTDRFIKEEVDYWEAKLK